MFAVPGWVGVTWVARTFDLVDERSELAQSVFGHQALEAQLGVQHRGHLQVVWYCTVEPHRKAVIRRITVIQVKYIRKVLLRWPPSLTPTRTWHVYGHTILAQIVAFETFGMGLAA